MKRLFAGRFALLFSFILTYILISFVTRLVFYVMAWSDISLSFVSIGKIFFLGFIFDLAVSICFAALYSLYLLLLPSRWIGSRLDKIVSYFVTSLMLFIALFAFFSEFPFWGEFSSRFNFIAVDYLIYTYEVVKNINESLPIPIIITGLVACVAIAFFIYKKRGILRNTFTTKTRLGYRALVIIPLFVVGFLGIFFLKNRMAETNENIYVNELSKNGVFSLFAAYRSNELNYNTFYPNMGGDSAYAVIRNELAQPNATFTSSDIKNIYRQINDSGNTKPNIVLIAIESFSADFLAHYGNTQHITPVYDALMDSSINFSNLYATGTRTVRGMEALTLCVPPTPGNSIVRRPGNANLSSIATILKEKSYDLKFIYGGDGYFDNMNTFFGGQGFDIVDRNRGNALSDDIKTTRYNIADTETSFENAWGICDEDIYTQSLKYASKAAGKNQPFFQFVMTTSNHKPFSYPAGKIDLPQGSREGAVKYTDYALGKYLEEASNQPWFANTVFVVVADHCASSAGKWEINIDRHHIPAIIYNFNNRKENVTQLCSQIDLMPTVFGLFKWSYTTALYGKDIAKVQPGEERALIGNYRTLGLLKQNVFTEINDRRKTTQYSWDPSTNTMKSLNGVPKDSLRLLTIAYYQTASERFSNGEMKEK